MRARRFDRKARDTYAVSERGRWRRKEGPKFVTETKTGEGRDVYSATYTTSPPEKRVEVDSRSPQPPPFAMDFFTHLPAEVIAYILPYLPVQDVLQCVQVCKSWNLSLRRPTMAPFWRRALEYVGLPEAYIRQNFSAYSAPDELFHQARTFTEHITTIRPEVKRLRGIHPFESTSKCEHAGSGYFVKTVDLQSLEHVETVIGELCPKQRVIHKLDSMPGKYGQVEYASLCNGNVIWQTTLGYWFRYDLSECTFHQFFQKIIKKQMGDSTGHCHDCFFLLIANTESIMHGYNWALNFIKVEEDGESVVDAKFKPHIPPGITQFIPRPVSVHLLSDDGCKSHRLIIQGGTGACVFDVAHNSAEKTIKISPKPIATLNPFFDSNIAVMVVTTSTHMVLSPDRRFLGILTSIVYPYTSGLCLHMFDVRTYKRVISCKVDWEEGYNDSHVIAVSGLFTIVCVSSGGGEVKVIHSKSGRVIACHKPLTKGLPPVIPMVKLTRVHMQGMYGVDGLVDVKGRFNVAVLYRKGVGNIDALFFDPFPHGLAFLEGREGCGDSNSEGEADDDVSL